jgi:hypothetical protein
MTGAAVADYRHVVGEDDFADDRDGATDENTDIARPQDFETPDATGKYREGSAETGMLRCYDRGVAGIECDFFRIGCAAAGAASSYSETPIATILTKAGSPTR